MLYCLNPSCNRITNPNNCKFCQGCGLDLAQCTKGYKFRERFLIKDLLGQGAFGRTYLAQDLDDIDKRYCVLKKFIAQVTGNALTTAINLFEREARALKKLNHPQIPDLYAYFEKNQSLYLVQEYIPGDNLFKERLKEGNFNEYKIREFLNDILPVLAYLHNNNRLHRDIKPENIMRRGAFPASMQNMSTKSGKFVLIDFGGVKQTTGTVMATPGTMIYTPGYAAFEHIQGQPCPASDLYSLGATCLRLMTGIYPRQDGVTNTIVDELYNSQTATWQWEDKLKAQGISISNELRNILNKLLQHLAINRFSSAEEVLKALNSPSHQFINTQPLTNSSTGILPVPPKNPTSNKSKTSKTSTGKIPVSPKNPTSNRGKTGKNSISSINKTPNSNNILRREILKFFGYGSLAVFATVIASNIFDKKDSSQISSENNDTSKIPSENNNNSTQISSENSNLQTFSFDTVTLDNSGNVIENDTKSAEYFTETLANGVELIMVKIPAGRFLMGSPESEDKRDNDESPQHWVDIEEFYLGKFTVTQAQWEAVMDSSPWQEYDEKFWGENKPVIGVSWNDAKEFCKKLSQETRKTYNLPSEAQWEYACRAVISHQSSVISENITKEEWNQKYNQPFHFGETITPDYVNYDGNYPYSNASEGVYRGKTVDVDYFQYGNNFGLYQMHGNVWEWCEDNYHNNYNNAPNNGNIWLNKSEENVRILRGGSWFNYSWDSRSAFRDRFNSDNHNINVGFRVFCLS